MIEELTIELGKPRNLRLYCFVSIRSVIGRGNSRFLALNLSDIIATWSLAFSCAAGCFLLLLFWVSFASCDLFLVFIGHWDKFGNDFITTENDSPRTFTTSIPAEVVEKIWIWHLSKLLCYRCTSSFQNRKRGNFVLPCFDFELFGVSNRNTKMEEKERRKHSSFMSTDAVRKKKVT